jgi:hypothetical protein
MMTEELRRNKQPNIKSGRVVEQADEDDMIANEFSSEGLGGDCKFSLYFINI